MEEDEGSRHICWYLLDMYLFICWTCICCSLRQGLRLGSRIRGHDIQMQPIDLTFNPYSGDGGGDDSIDGRF